MNALLVAVALFSVAAVLLVAAVCESYRYHHAKRRS